MTERVVDLLESVEVEQQDGGGGIGQLRQHLIGPLVEVRPVGQAGQDVVERLIGQARLGLLFHRSGSAGHADHDDQHAGTEGADGLGVEPREERRCHAESNQELGDDDGEEGPSEGGPPAGRAALLELLERHEDEGHAEHRAPAGHVDDDGNARHVEGDPGMQLERTDRCIAPALEGGRYDGRTHDDGHVGPNGQSGDEPVLAEDGQDNQSQRPHYIGQHDRRQSLPGVLGLLGLVGDSGDGGGGLVGSGFRSAPSALETRASRRANVHGSLSATPRRR